jgi:hypothetical protein
LSSKTPDLSVREAAGHRLVFGNGNGSRKLDKLLGWSTKKHPERGSQAASGSLRILRSMRKCSRLGVASIGKVRALGESGYPKVLQAVVLGKA